MRRLARWTLNALTVLSLLLCVATAGLWVRSYYRGYSIHWNTLARDGFVGTPEGDLEMQWTGSTRSNSSRGLKWSSFNPLSAINEDKQLQSYPGVRHHWRFVGLMWFAAAGINGDAVRFPPANILHLPIWPIVILLAWLPTVRITRTICLRYRLAAGRCGKCSYHLTGNVSGVCPECGTSVAKATSPPAESFR